MKRILVIGLVVVLMLIPLMGVSCSGNGDTTTIKNVINDMWDVYYQGNYTQALTYCTNYDDENEEIAQMTIIKNSTDTVTVESIENINISDSTAVATVTFNIAGQTYVDEVELVKVDGSWKVNREENTGYESAVEELQKVELAVTAACAVLDVGVNYYLFPLNEGIVDGTHCTVTSKRGIALDVGIFLIDGYSSLKYTYSVDTDGLVTATSGPLEGLRAGWLTIGGLSSQVELDKVQPAVVEAMGSIPTGTVDPGGTIDSTACTVTYDGGIPLPVGDYIVGGLELLAYSYGVTSDGEVYATSGPLWEIAGNYFHQDNADANVYLRLSENGRYKMHVYSTEVGGGWKVVEANEITAICFTMWLSGFDILDPWHCGIVEGNKLIDPDGIVWVKE